jgi:hypothetical protein
MNGIALAIILLANDSATPGICWVENAEKGTLVQCSRVPIPTAVEFLGKYSGNVTVTLANPKDCHGTMNLRWLSNAPILEAANKIFGDVARNANGSYRFEWLLNHDAKTVTVVCNAPSS